MQENNTHLYKSIDSTRLPYPTSRKLLIELAKERKERIDKTFQSEEFQKFFKKLEYLLEQMAKLQDDYCLNHRCGDCPCCTNLNNPDKDRRSCFISDYFHSKYRIDCVKKQDLNLYD